MSYFFQSKTALSMLFAGVGLSCFMLVGCAGGPDQGVAVAPVVNQADYTVAAGPDFHVRSGDNAPLNCGGPKDSSYQWIIESNSGLPIELSSFTTAKSGFTAPIVPVATVIRLACRMTLTNTVAATATYAASTATTVVTSRVAVTIDPLDVAATLMTKITGNKTTGPGQRLSLSAVAGWYDGKAASTAGPVITYKWVLGSGYPDGTLITPTDGADVDVIIPTKIEKPVFFPVTVTATSGTKTATSTVTVLVNPFSDINVNISPSVQAVQSGATTTLTATATGAKMFYQWTVVTGPAVTLASANTSSVSFVAPTVTAQTTMILRLAVGYSPITTAEPGVYFIDGVVTVNP